MAIITTDKLMLAIVKADESSHPVEMVNYCVINLPGELVDAIEAAKKIANVTYEDTKAGRLSAWHKEMSDLLKKTSDRYLWPALNALAHDSAAPK